jgi:hypothetical protein
VAFTESNSIALGDVNIADFFAANRSLGYTELVNIVLLGPRYAIPPCPSGYDRTSAEIVFDFVAPMNGAKVVLMTRETNRYGKREGNGNLDPVACYMPDETMDRSCVEE